ncbi:MAG: hypothetical protein KC635_12300, partial [Myxococcales bacterium]|nr:hypothetical protein [Myxococcales bacterium]
MNHRSFPRRARALGALLVAVGLAAVAVAPAGIAAPPPAVKLNPVGKPLSAAKIWKKQRQISKQAKAVKKELKMERKAGLMTRKEYRSAMTALRKDKMARQRAVLQREQAYAKLFAPAARWAKAQNKAAVRADIAIRMGSSPRAVRALYRDALKRDAARWNKALETWRAAERQFGPLVGTKRGSRELSFAR